MRKKQILKVKELANEVIQRCDAALQDATAWANLSNEVARYNVGTKATGALRRASMELTRALAEMRKP